MHGKGDCERVEWDFKFKIPTTCASGKSARPAVASLVGSEQDADLDI